VKLLPKEGTFKDFNFPESDLVSENMPQKCLSELPDVTGY
jgi:hypothetical protein